MRMVSNDVLKAVANRQIADRLSEIKRRHALLTHDEELQLASDVQAGIAVMQRYEDRDSFQNFDSSKLKTSKERSIWRQATQSKNRLIMSNMRLVVHVGYSQGYFLLERADPEDLIQAGALGLNRAAEKFDPAKGYKFSTYAFFWIRQSMLRMMQTKSRAIRLPLHLQAEIIKLREFVGLLSSELGRSPSKIEIVEHANDREIFKPKKLTVERLDYLLEQRRSIRSLDAPADNATNALGEIIADDSSQDILEQTERSLQINQLERLIKQTCSQTEIYILTKRYLEPKPTSYRQLAADVDLPQSAVKRLEKKTLSRLRQEVSSTSLLESK